MDSTGCLFAQLLKKIKGMILIIKLPVHVKSNDSTLLAVHRLIIMLKFYTVKHKEYGGYPDVCVLWSAVLRPLYNFNHLVLIDRDEPIMPALKWA